MFSTSQTTSQDLGQLCRGELIIYIISREYDQFTIDMIATECRKFYTYEYIRKTIRKMRLKGYIKKIG